RLRHSEDANDVGRVDVERFAPGLGHDADHVPYGGRPLLIVRVEPPDALARPPAATRLRPPRGNPHLEALGEAVVGGVHRCKERVSTIARYLEGVELRCLADLGIPRAVGVPTLSAVKH